MTEEKKDEKKSNELVKLIIFAILGIILVYFVHPYVTIAIHLIPDFLAIYIIVGLVSLVLLDIVTTLSTLFNLKDKLEEAKLLAEKISEEGKDKAKNSEVIKQLEEVKNSIINKTNFLHDRIIDAFPKLEFKKYKIQFGELKEGITKKKQNKKDKNKKDKKSK